MNVDGVVYNPTSLEMNRPLSLTKWLDLLRGLGAMATGHQWWIGDALIEGEKRFGEEAGQGEAALGIPTQTALNWRWVASRIDASRRREAPLSFSHHAEVARLEPDDQEKALDHATAHGLGVRELRDYVALTWPQPHEPGSSGGDPAPHNDLTDAELASIARRLETLQEALERCKHDGPGTDLDVYFDTDDVDWLIRTLRWLTRGGTR